MSGVKHFQAKDPKRILDYLHEREQQFKEKKIEIEKIIPKLKNKYAEEKYQSVAEVYEGVKGFKTFYESVLKILKKGDCVDILGASREAERFQSYFMDWNKRREKLGIKMRIVYNHDCREFGEKREKLKLSQVKYMEQSLETPAWVVMFLDYVVTANVHGNPICFLIKNKETANSYKEYFNMIWKQTRA